MTWDAVIPLLTLLVSLLAAVIIFLLPEDRVRMRTTVNMLSATLKIALIVVMIGGVFHGHRYEFRFPIVPGIDFILRADPLALFFAALSGLLWFLTTIYAIAYLEGTPQRSRFFGFFSLCVSATAGIALAGNLFTFVMFYELLTLTTYPLVVHRETEASRRAGRSYLAYTLAGGALLLAGAAWLHVLVPTVDFGAGASLAGLGPEYRVSLRTIFFLLVSGLGVKAALIPLHGWLPQAMVAPAPVSALLHAVAVVKAGAFGIVRVVYDIYGIERTHSLELMSPLAVWASATIIYGSMRALFQDDLKRRLAYSTVSQVSYIALGVALVGPSSTVGGLVHLVHQGLMKITLFFCAGNLAEMLGVHRVSQMHGVGRRMPWTMIAFTAGALGMIGVPPMAGFVSKWYLAAGAIEASQTWVLAVLATSSLLNAAYFLPILYNAWFAAPRGEWEQGHRLKRTGTDWGLLLPPLATGALAVSSGLFAGSSFSPLRWGILIVERTYQRIVVARGLGNERELFSLDTVLLLLAVGTPLLIACFLSKRATRRSAQFVASFAALPAVIAALLVRPGTTVFLDGMLLHMRLGLDELGQPFFVLTAILWLAAGVFAAGHLADDRRVHRFLLGFLLAMAGNLGLVLALDMASFYLFFAVMSFASYSLVVHHGDNQAMRAGRVYMVLVVIGEAALFAGIVLAMKSQDSLYFGSDPAGLAAASGGGVMLGLLMFGFGIKAGVIPLHVWLPLAHPAAPTPASAVLSGAMIKAGLLGWIRFFPLGDVALPAWGELFLLLGLITAFYGILVGVTQQNAKAVLAYSSISQMGLITLGLGGAFLQPKSWPAIQTAMLIYVLHHGLSKGCLFFSVSIAPGAGGTSCRQRLTQAALVIPALAIAGAPLTMGAVSKYELKHALDILPEHWKAAVSLLLPLSSVGTTLLMARFLYLIWPRNPGDKRKRSPLQLAAWLASLGTVIGAAWLVPETLAPKSAAGLLLGTWKWSNLWPVGLGGGIACVIVFVSPRWLRMPVIPAGDILVPFSKSWRLIAGEMRSLSSRVVQARESFRPLRYIESRLAAAHCFRAAQSCEATMARWPWLAVCLASVVAACWFSWQNR